ncbi:MAG: hypothetical protein JWR58_1400 [Pseudonocardia sp.]|nr:hypothetical protein [Pseudonocardia sp.]
MAVNSVLEVWIGPVHLDVPRTVGYYGGVGIAVGAGLVEPPLGLFIAAVPFLKLLTHHALPVVVRFVGEVMEGLPSRSAAMMKPCSTSTMRARPSRRLLRWRWSWNAATTCGPPTPPSPPTEPHIAVLDEVKGPPRACVFQFRSNSTARAGLAPGILGGGRLAVRVLSRRFPRRFSSRPLPTPHRSLQPRRGAMGIGASVRWTSLSLVTGWYG